MALPLLGRAATLRHLLSLMLGQPDGFWRVKLSARDFISPAKVTIACPLCGVVPSGIAGEIILAHPFANQGDSFRQPV
jgi:hypothetical protein